MFIAVQIILFKQLWLRCVLRWCCLSKLRKHRISLTPRFSEMTRDLDKRNR